MTAIKGGSIKFVPGVFPPFEVHNMYAIRIGNETGSRRNDALREYARAEYGTPEIALFLASEGRRAKSRPARPGLRSRLLRRHARPALRPLPHKGTPGFAFPE